MPDPEPGAAAVRIRIEASGVNPGDVKKRQDAFGYGMPYRRVVPHSDGAGRVDRVGDRVPSDWLGQRVWCYGAQSYRPFGTAAEYAVVPAQQVMPLPASVSMEQGACLGIPGITAHRSVHAGGPVSGCSVLVHGGAGAVGVCAVQLARRAGASVIATVRSPEQEATARRAGAHHVLVTGPHLVDKVRALAPGGVHHVVDVAFGANVAANVEMLAVGGAIATYATDGQTAEIPYWDLAFKNVRMYFLGSDDFPAEAKAAAARTLNEALEAGWEGFDISERVPLADIATAHELVEQHARRGRVVVVI